MRIRPRWWIGLGAVAVYAIWVMALWAYHGIDYREIQAESNLPGAVIQPLGVAAVLLAVFTTYAGWWRAVLFEASLFRHRGLLALLSAEMAGFICLTLWNAQLAEIPASHLLALIVATLLVGFCEELSARGILLVSLRGSLQSEAWVWFWSSLAFGLLHATNAFFGVGALALLQVLLAFCVGTGLYVLRRLSGTLLLPMLVHAMWDFASLSAAVTHSPPAPPAVAVLVCTYVTSLFAAIQVLRDKRAPAHNTA